eukprot:CAMPEP_0182527592 /NCGR_PEP_ID=MMETSP1323-20130603/3949_1 /TAXON_ID=236787 /ORGANISM="Florenciella parvula, Strain RCC1693" /LENGTH=151 /DNA_ID=CAMNT_0024736597 /DNA_START=163 /DNA_END=618 /DNA_ORIENTATION=+
MRVVSALVAIALIPLAAMGKDVKATPMGRPNGPPGQGGPAMGGGGMDEHGHGGGGRPGGKDRMAPPPRGPPGMDKMGPGANAAPRLDLEIVNKLREAKLVPHQVATGVVEEAEALKVLSREQLDTLIQHGKDRLAAGVTRGPPPKKMEKKN